MGRSVFWFKKPIARCPVCKTSLRQNTPKKRWKEQNRIATQLFVKRKIYLGRYNFARKDQLKNYLRNRYSADEVFRETIKKRRREYGAKNRKNQAESLKKWRHKNGISKNFYKKPQENLQIVKDTLGKECQQSNQNQIILSVTI